MRQLERFGDCHMHLFMPSVPTARDEYEQTHWVRQECYRFYVAQRREHCTHLQLMDLWLRAPYCSECILSYPFHPRKLPDISPSTWAEDVECQLGEEALARAKEAEAEHDSSIFQCKRCGAELAPWDGDEIYIVYYHLEEHYQIPLETSGRTVSEKLTRTIFQLYDNKCFACGKSNNLHIDHVLPRALGGTAAFRHLQPLCELCGQKKGKTRPDEIEVYSDIYFGPYASDSYEGLFW